MKKVLYITVLICILAVFTACAKDINNIEKPIIILTCSEGEYVKRMWVQEVDVAFEAIDNVVKTTYLKDSNVAAELVWNEEHNGKFFLTMFEEALSLPVNDGSERTLEDWEMYIMGKSPEVVCVRNDLEISSTEELISQLSSNKITIASTKGHSEFCTKLLLKLIAADDREILNVAKNEKGEPIEYIDDEVDVIVAVPNEIILMVESGEWIPLWVIGEESYNINGFEDVASITEVIPEFSTYLPLDRLYGIMIPSGTPEEIKLSLLTDFNEQSESGQYNEFFERYLISEIFLTGNEARDYASNIQSNMCWALYDLGEAKYNPKDYSIPKP